MKGVTVVAAVVQRMRLTVLLRSRSKLLDFYGRFHPSVLSIQQFIEFGQEIFSCLMFRLSFFPVDLSSCLVFDSGLLMSYYICCVILKLI